MSDFITEIEHDIEHFASKPGGIIDRHHQRVAEREAADAQREHIAEGIEQPSYKAVKTAPESPEIITSQTFTILPGKFTQILPVSPYRYRSVVTVIPPVIPANTVSNTGTAAAPAAGATITQLSLPPGVYQVTWTVQLSGTLAAADANNFQLFQSGSGSNFVVENSLNPATAGNWQQLSVTVTSTNANNFIKVLTIGAATAGSSYGAQLTITQIAGAVGPVSLARDENAALGGTGDIIPPGIPVPLYTRAQLYAFNGGSGTVQVSVISELYAPVRHSSA